MICLSNKSNIYTYIILPHPFHVQAMNNTWHNGQQLTIGHVTKNTSTSRLMCGNRMVIQSGR